MKTYNMNNDKKDNKELSPDDLKKASGGFLSEIVHDSIYLKDLGLLPDTVGDIYTLCHWDDATSFVEGGWAKVGITCVTSYECCNNYYYQGQKSVEMMLWKSLKKHALKDRRLAP